MARLNEPPSSESLESLKRRFIRQNRELARSNSTQSVKIRNLETHISQLIANNVSLRATVIQLQSELDGSRTCYFSENVDAVKRKLEEKLQEVGGLVAELNSTKTNPPKKPKSPARSPSQKLWKTNAGIGDTLEGREGWLPTITEGKYFPRRTLDPIEIADLAINGSSDSPDIGPPPQISINGNVSPANRPRATSDESVRESEDTSVSSLLSSNLETRRRRRESNVRRDSGEGVSTDGSPSRESHPNRSAELWTTQPIRAGAKRKLDVANRPGGSDDSTMKNRNPSTSSKVGSATNAGKDTDPQKSPARKALAPKSVNTDPVVSPKKAVVQEKPQEGLTQKQSSREISQRSQMHKVIKSRTSRVEPTSDVVKSVEIPPPDAIKSEPKTPAPFDLLSPLSTEPSESRPEGRGDTPPPANLTSLSVIRGENAAGGRGSRRARASVNYAEPNLISKMRRPTKELVNAVWHDQSRATSASVEPPETTQETLDQNGAFKTAVIKSDNSSNDDAKGPAPVEDNRPEPQSPLDKKDEASKKPAFDRSTARDRRRSALHQSGSSTNTSEGQTASSAALSAPVSGSRRSSTATENGATASLEDTLQKLDIYDVAPSPPRPFALSKPKDKPQTARPSSAASERSTGSSSEKKSASASSTLNKPKSRRQTVGTDKSDIKSLHQGPGAITGVSKDREVKPSRSVVALSEKAASDTKTTAERVAERTAARRRSMML